MTDIYFTNSLTRKREKFVPIVPQKVGFYACGPTVYNFASIGNFRTYTTADLINRVLKYNGYDVTYIMNITDVGHLTGDNEGDADTGEDRMEKAAKREKKDIWEIAKMYTDAFLKEYKSLNLLPPKAFTKATDHIQEQIQLIEELEKKGFTYTTTDGVYFDTKVFEEKTKKTYGELSTLDQIKEGARVEANPEKKNPRDFALWKFSPKDEKRQMEWESPWGVGFPGWHIECSAMSMKYLGETFDIHTGGEDLQSTHHPNEIAQSEAVTGKPFVHYWIHSSFLKVDGKRMGKSLGNAYTVSDVEEKGYNPLSLRYFYLSGHYKDTLNFTWEALSASQTALNRLYDLVSAAKRQTERSVLSLEKQKKVDDFNTRFIESINDDVNTAKALAILWEVMKSNIPSEDKYDLALSFDEVLGLKLSEIPDSSFEIPHEVELLLQERFEARKTNDFTKSDELRKAINDAGFEVLDTKDGQEVKKR